MGLNFYVISLLLVLCHGVSQAQIVNSCTEPGKFPYDENQDCSGFVVCLIGGLSDITEIKLACPQGFVYSHLEEQCTNATNYKCYPNFNCTSANNFTNPEIDNCTATSYISCVMGMKGMATARLIECPLNTTFDSMSRQCVDKSLIVCSVPTTVNPTTSPPPTTTPNLNRDIITNVTHPNNTRANNAVSQSALYRLMLIFTIIMVLIN